MATNYRPDRRTIGELLSTTSPPIVVPDWQRSYSWTLSEIDTFWQDLLRFDRFYPGNNINTEEYFLGSLVIVDNNKDNLLLDGQQRLATSAILLSVIRDFLKKYKSDAATSLSRDYLAHYDFAEEKKTYKLTLNKYDRDFFRKEILEDRDASYSPPKPNIYSHKLIRKAREFFASMLQKHYDELNNPEASFKWALRIQKVLTSHFSLIAVVSVDEENASTVFETLNDRGIGLSTPDLLRNFIISRANEQDRDEIINIWGDILGIENDVSLKTFLRHFWISHEGDIKTQSLYRAMRNAIKDRKINSIDFSRRLKSSSEKYHEIISGQDDISELSNTLKTINDINATVLYPCILSAYEDGDKTNLGKFLKTLLVTYTRHNIICNLENNRLENILYEIASSIRKDHNLINPMRKLIEFSPENEQFQNSFKTVSLTLTSTARYVLKEIERKLRRTEELEVANSDKVHVEHIYPKTPKQGEKWENHDMYINRLGNLTLLSKPLNQAIKNSRFNDKKPYYEQSELMQTKNLVTEFTEWNTDTVDTRQKNMSTAAVEIWAFPI